MNNKRIEELERDILNLKIRVSQLERGFSAGSDGKKSALVVETTSSDPVSPFTVLPAPEEFIFSGESRLHQQPAAGTEWSRLLAITAVICFVLAGTFLVRLAIESGWLNAGRQWSMVLLLGTALVGTGRFTPRIDRSYRSYLSAAGVIVLYAAAFGSSLYFELTSQPVSLLLGIGVTGVGLGLFSHHRSEIFPIIVAAGTYLAPIILGRSDFDLLLMGGYYLLWSGVFGWFATFFESRSLLLISSYLGLGGFAALSLKFSAPEELLTIIAVLCGQFILSTQSVLRHTLLARTALTAHQAWSLFPAICFFYGVTYFFLSRLTPSLAPWISFAFAGFLLLVERQARRALDAPDGLPSKEMVGAFLAVVLFHAGYLQLMPSGATAWILPFWILAKYLSEQKNAFPRMGRAVELLGLVLGVVELFRVSVALAIGEESSSILVAITTLVLGWLYYFNTKLSAQKAPAIFLGAIHALAILALYRMFRSAGSTAVSAVWGAYALVILGLGFVRHDSLIARSSLIVLLSVTLKALVYDASMASAGVRVVCLLLTGVLLYGSGLLFRKMSYWSQGPT